MKEHFESEIEKQTQDGNDQKQKKRRCEINVDQIHSEKKVQKNLENHFRNEDKITAQ